MKNNVISFNCTKCEYVIYKYNSELENAIGLKDTILPNMLCGYFPNVLIIPFNCILKQNEK